MFVRRWLNKRLIQKQKRIRVAAAIKNTLPGFRYNPHTVPAHNGRTIRRKGISLYSTARSL
jgi:hypothetical protein